MENRHRATAVALLAGVLAFSALQLLQFLLAQFTSLHPTALMDPQPYPAWSHIAQQILSAVQLVGPALLAGWLAKHSGILVGAATGVFGSIGGLAVLTLLIGPDYLKTFEPAWVFGVLVYAIIPSAVGGVAGVALREWAAARSQR